MPSESNGADYSRVVQYSLLVVCQASLELLILNGDAISG